VNNTSSLSTPYAVVSISDSDETPFDISGVDIVLTRTGSGSSIPTEVTGVDDGQTGGSIDRNDMESRITAITESAVATPEKKYHLSEPSLSSEAVEDVGDASLTDAERNNDKCVVEDSDGSSSKAVGVSPRTMNELLGITNDDSDDIVEAQQ
jgi:hypothetical protein